VKALIVLHSVTKEIKRPGTGRHRVLHQIDWVIPPRTQYIIFGHKGSGKTTLLNIVSGLYFPTQGWVERRGSICYPKGLQQIASATASPRNVAMRIARLYHTKPDDVANFIARFAAMDAQMDRPLAHLSKGVRQRFNQALIYAVPFDLYLFDDRLAPRGEFGERCLTAIRARCQHAGLIFTTSQGAAVRAVDNAAGGVLYEGNLMLFDTAEEAVKHFYQLPQPALDGDFIDQDETGEEEEPEELLL
jgi:ABC-type polysaccharide/polyol phosphate transport system ATPase subunit